jgi:hypothetical protein
VFGWEVLVQTKNGFITDEVSQIKHGKFQIHQHQRDPIPFLFV